MQLESVWIRFGIYMGVLVSIRIGRLDIDCNRAGWSSHYG